MTPLVVIIPADHFVRFDPTYLFKRRDRVTGIVFRGCGGSVVWIYGLKSLLSQF